MQDRKGKVLPDVIMRAKKRDPQAISTLYNENVKFVYRFVYYKTGFKEIAEDLTAETFVRAIEKLEGFEGRCTFKSWLYSIAKNLIYDWYQNRSKSVNLIYEPKDSESELTDPETDIANEKDDNENADLTESKLNKIINSLASEREREVLIMRFLWNYTVKETAQELGITENYVKVTQNRAIKNARKIASNLDKNV